MCVSLRHADLGKSLGTIENFFWIVVICRENQIVILTWVKSVRLREELLRKCGRPNIHVKPLDSPHTNLLIALFGPAGL